MLRPAVAEDRVLLEDSGEGLQECRAADQRQPLGVAWSGLADPRGQGWSR
jgi:hypothetical protein